VDRCEETTGRPLITVPDRSPAAILGRLRGAVSPRAKRLLDRVDEKEVRQARRLAKALRTSPPDVIAFGDSNWVFQAPYDEDRRSLEAMLRAELGPEVSLLVCSGAGYHPLLIAAFVRLIARHGARPVLVVPVCARMTSDAWRYHPRYAYDRVAAIIDGFDATTPLWRMRASQSTPDPAEFERYEQMAITTWVGDTTVGELRAKIIAADDHGLHETERRQLLYAYHHGETLREGQAALAEVEALGAALKGCGSAVVAFETTVPVDEGVALWGEQFRANVDRTFTMMRAALRRGFGAPLDIEETGLTFDRESFIDPADGTEHLNERGRHRVADLLAERIRAALAVRSA
jgi:hypothetical protein